MAIFVSLTTLPSYNATTIRNLGYIWWYMSNTYSLIAYTFLGMCIWRSFNYEGSCSKQKFSKQKSGYLQWRWSFLYEKEAIRYDNWLIQTLWLWGVFIGAADFFGAHCLSVSEVGHRVTSPCPDCGISYIRVRLLELDFRATCLCVSLGQGRNVSVARARSVRVLNACSEFGGQPAHKGDRRVRV